LTEREDEVLSPDPSAPLRGYAGQAPGPRTPDPTVRSIFDRWDLYDLIVANDYMFHRAIHSALRESLADSRAAPFSVVDLGCGNCGVIARTLRGLPIARYVGVDLSESGLELARENFAGTEFGLEMVAADLAEYVRRADVDPVDVAIAGFAVHHLKDDEKTRFFHDCAGKLRPGGDLYLYDVFRHDGQGLDEYLDAYCGHIEAGWDGLTVDEKERVTGHIRAMDFPCSFETMAEFAKDAGFDAPITPLFSDDRVGFHRLYRFTTA